MSNKRQRRTKWRKKQNQPKYEVWKANQSKVNHIGSANSMESVGAIRSFEQSRATRDLKYKDMLGDGDSPTYNSIVHTKPYEDECIPKLECTGHVQKRVGSRLHRKLKSAKKGWKRLGW